MNKEGGRILAEINQLSYLSVLTIQLNCIQLNYINVIFYYHL